MRSRLPVLLLALSACSAESSSSISKSVRLADGYVAEPLARPLAEHGEAAVAVGALPEGLALSPDGVLSGRVDVEGDYSVGVALTGADGTRVVTVALAVRAAPALRADVPAEVVVGEPQRWALTADGGARPMRVEVVELPPGMRFDGPAVSGAIATPGTHALRLRLRDANGRAAELVSPVVATPRLEVPAGAITVYPGEVVEVPLAASGGRAPYSWSLVSGALPAGLSLFADGHIGGVATEGVDPHAVVPSTLPLERAPLAAVVRATDASGQRLDSTLTFVVVPAPRISSLRLPDAYAGEAVRLPVALSGLGTRLVSTRSDAGFTAEGAQLSGQSGTPRETSVTLVAEDASGRRDARALPLSVLAPPRIETLVLPEPMVGQDYAARLAASGGRAPYRWRVGAGALPAGLALVGEELRGNPSVSGEAATLTLVVEDANGREDRVPFDLAVLGRGHAVLTTQLPDAYAGEQWQAQLAATAMLGGVVDWSASALPAWLALDTSGRLAGLPRDDAGTSPPGPSVFAVVARDGAAVATRTLQLDVRAGLACNPAAAARAFAGTPFALQLHATGGRPPLTFEPLALPAGLALDSDGTLHGALDAGARRFAFRVRDANGRTLEVADALDVLPPLALDANLTPSGGVAPYRFALALDAPSGITLTADGRVLSSRADRVPVTVFVDDAAGQRRAATVEVTAPRG